MIAVQAGGRVDAPMKDQCVAVRADRVQLGGSFGLRECLSPFMRRLTSPSPATTQPSARGLVVPNKQVW